LTPGPWRWKTHQFNYGEPEYDYLYGIVNGEQVLRPTWTDNPIAVDPEDARRIGDGRGPRHRPHPGRARCRPSQWPP
jgi:hypothetical protein